MKKVFTALSLVIATLGLSFFVYSDGSIHRAAYEGRVDEVRDLLENDLDVNSRDSFGGTALHAAMFQSNTDIVRLLIDAGFDVNAVGPNNGYTPLHDAVWGNNLPALKILVENGGDTSIKGLKGMTPLDKARNEGKNDIVRYLESLK